MIYAQPGQPFEAVFDNAPTGLVGTIAVRVLRNSTGTLAVARSTAGVTEPVAGSGIYLYRSSTAPAEDGRYTIIWDTGTTTPATTATEEMVVSGQPIPYSSSAAGNGTAVSVLIAQVLGEGSFDATESQALGWLDQRHKLMCARTKCFRKKITMATVAAQQSYPVPNEVQEIREVLVVTPTSNGLGVPYGAGRHSDLAQGALGYIWLGGLYRAAGGGIFVRDQSAEGEDELALYPTPTESGLQIVIHAICRPPALALGTAVRTPPEFDDGLVAGAIATGLERLEARPDLAAQGEQRYASACSELQEQVNRRFRRPGGAEIRVAGVNG